MHIQRPFAGCVGKYYVLGFGLAFVTILLLTWANWPSNFSNRRRREKGSLSLQASPASLPSSKPLSTSELDFLKAGNFRLTKLLGALGCDHEYIFQCYQTLFRIILAYDSPKGSIQKGFLNQLDRAYAQVEPDIDSCEAIEERIGSLLKDLVTQFALRFATSIEHDGTTIDDLVNSHVFDLELVTANGKLRVMLRNQGALGKSLFASLEKSLLPIGLPSILASNLEIVDEVVEDAVYNVQHGPSGALMRCRILGDSSRTQEYLQELRLFHRLQGYKLELRVPTILGLIRDDSGVIWGYACEYIDGKNLAELDVDEQDIVRRKRWTSQLRSFLLQIQHIGIRSDDVPPSAITVNNNDELCLVDLSYGFMDCSSIATKATADISVPGDAVITKFLKLDWQPPLFWTKS